MIEMKKKLAVIALAVSGLFAVSCNNEVSLAGEWLIDTVGSEKVVTMEKAPFLEFDESASEVHGFLGVNIANGGYTREGNNISFGNLGMTMMAGRPQDMDTESKIQKALGEVAGMSGKGSSIVLLDADGNQLMSLVRKDSAK